MAQHRVTLRVAAGPGAGEAELSVTDDGPGVGEEQLTWLKEPFTTTHHALFGLGLALARRVTALHGGRVAADNLPGGGYRVRLVLPASPPA
jgi:signal transduction histidine kinase